MTRRLIVLLVLSSGVGLCLYSFSSSQAGTAGQAAKKNAEGRKLFMQYCATCYGAQAKRTPSHKARSADRGSSTTSDLVSKRMVALRLRSYFGQPQSPLAANATQAACMASASCCGGSVPQSSSVPWPSLSKTKAISSARPSKRLAC